jgi:hypothetical protein
MIRRFVVFSFVLWIGELVASWYVWATVPSDTLQVWYPSFWMYEFPRFCYWTVAFSCSALLWFVILYGFPRFLRSPQRNASRSKLPRTSTMFPAVLGLCLAVGIEISTSIIFWRHAPPYAQCPYYSLWDVHLIPYWAHTGGQSFKGYAWDHLTYWLIVLTLCLCVRFCWRMWPRVKKRVWGWARGR